MTITIIHFPPQLLFWSHFPDLLTIALGPGPISPWLATTTNTPRLVEAVGGRKVA